MDTNDQSHLYKPKSSLQNISQYVDYPLLYLQTKQKFSYEARQRKKARRTISGELRGIWKDQFRKMNVVYFSALWT